MIDLNFFKNPIKRSIKSNLVWALMFVVCFAKKNHTKVINDTDSRLFNENEIIWPLIVFIVLIVTILYYWSRQGEREGFIWAGPQALVEGMVEAQQDTVNNQENRNAAAGVQRGPEDQSRNQETNYIPPNLNS